MHRARLGVWLRYGSALLAVAAATVSRVILDSYLGYRHSFLTFVAAAAFTSWYAGLGPALLSIVLGGLIGLYFFVPTRFTFTVDRPADWIDLGLFLAVGLLCVLFSELARRSQEEAEARRLDAQEANQAKDRFLAVLSHELRTPLSPILGIIGLLERKQLPVDATQDLAVIRRNVEIEAQLIDDLLDVTRITRGKLSLHFELVDIHALLREVVESCRKQLQDRKLTLSLALDAESHHVSADPVRIQQVFWNLLLNAIKFTPPGGNITIRSHSPMTLECAIEIIDTGVGISAENLAKLFKPFEQAGADASHQFGGLGLGLAISRSLIEMQGGTLTAASEGKGHGATFTVRLPARAPAAALAADEPAPALSRHPLSILLVEDHQDTALVTGRLLRGFGHQVTVASNVEEARQAAGKQHFDLMISDLGLPDGSGLELMREVKDRYGLRGIATSGFGMEEDVRKSREAGFDRHLTKPLAIEQLEAAVEEFAVSV